MSTNVIDLIALKKLFEKHFFIPNYQRGYRWTKQQVVDLLEDLNEFDQEPLEKQRFYCMQPLVVKQKPECGPTWYEVVDGQQRLTTFYLLLKALEEDSPTELFEIKYERNLTLLESFFQNLRKDDQGLCEIDTSTIDRYHLSNAYQTIQSWLKKDSERKSRLRNLLYAYDLRSNGDDEEPKDYAHNVRFIWYETQEPDPIKVFTRLNIGKISLTNAELIKALLLNQKNFSECSDEYAIRLRQQEVASEWDYIERVLQKPDFWLFLNNTGYTHPTRIDFILDLIVEENPFDVKEDIGSDHYKTFRYFYAYFKKADDCSSSKIEKCWAKVQEYYRTFVEWYEDLELYHYVGYLLACGEKLRDLLNIWHDSKDKNDFLTRLKARVYGKVSTNKSQYNPDGSDKVKSKSILLFHNIQTAINRNQRETEKYNMGVMYRFPFHLYKLESWDIEHINSSTENDLADEDARKEWLVNVYLMASIEDQERIRRYFGKDETPEEEKPKIFDKVKESFPEPDGWTDETKNQIGNYVLLDSSTNRSYGNAIFSAKRRIIIDKDNGYLTPLPKLTRGGSFEEPDEEPQRATSSFVPLCTKSVFMKYYSPVMGDSNYWTIADAKAYENDIQRCIEQIKPLEQDHVE